MTNRCRNCPVAEGLSCPGEGVRRLCDLVDPDHPAFIAGYDRAVVAAAAGESAPSMLGEPIEYPPIVQQAGDLARSLWSWALSGFSVASREETKRRLSICLGCEFFDATQGRCTKCGCLAKFKNRLSSAHCPLEPPRW